MRGRKETLQFPHCMVVVFATFPHQTLRGFTQCLVLPVEIVYPVGWLETEGSPGPIINLPLAKTEPTRKEQVQNTIVISFLETFPNVLVRSPQTQ